MLYNVVVNDWGETTYVPTALGNVLLVVVLIALLAVAVVFARKQRNKTATDDVDQKMAHGKLTVKQLAFCAMAIALGTVLSNIKLFHFPTGGSITLLSMLVICLPGYWWSGTWRSCIQRMDYRGSSPSCTHAVHAVSSGSIQGSEELHKKLCRGSFIS